jgi:hypothetical protein
MKEQLITFETAKLAKEKGFGLDKYLSIDDENPKNLSSNFNPREYQPWYFDLTQSLLQKWLREVHNIQIEPLWRNDFGDYCYKLIEIKKRKYSIEDIGFKAYEQALEIGLQEGLKLI